MPDIPGMKFDEIGSAQRKPTLLFLLSGSFLLRLAERTLFSLLFHAPPRRTRSGVPAS